MYITFILIDYSKKITQAASSYAGNHKSYVWGIHVGTAKHHIVTGEIGLEPTTC
jgi:hypothetical protein